MPPSALPPVGWRRTGGRPASASSCRRGHRAGRCPAGSASAASGCSGCAAARWRRRCSSSPRGGRCGSPSALRTAASRSIGSSPGAGRSVALIDAVHSGSSVPLTIRRFSASSVFCSDRFGVDEVLAPRRLFRLRLHDVDRRHRADLDAGPVVLHQLRREVERGALVLQVQDGEDEIPVGVAHLRHRARGRRLQIELRQVLLNRGRQQVGPSLVDLAVGQDRLGDRPPGTRPSRPG